jgi:Na+-transporting methylmalonyl-CoA/oxaloacetate decarboxylase gamma subunit
MTTAPTIKALFSVLVIVLLVCSVTAIGEAIGHDAPTSVSTPATSPYSQVEAPAQQAVHNRPEAAQASRPGHNH